jgi:hypothetical protein
VRGVVRLSACEAIREEIRTSVKTTLVIWLGTSPGKSDMGLASGIAHTTLNFGSVLSDVGLSMQEEDLSPGVWILNPFLLKELCERGRCSGWVGESCCGRRNDTDKECYRCSPRLCEQY